MIIIKFATHNIISKLLEFEKQVALEFFKPLFLQYPNHIVGKDPDYIIHDDLIRDEKMFNNFITNSGKDTGLNVAYNNDIIVGFVAFHKKDTILYIDFMLVDKNMRGQGLGKKLLETAFATFANITTCYLAVINKNISARAFYEHLGFRLVAEIPIELIENIPPTYADLHLYYKISLNGK